MDNSKLVDYLKEYKGPKIRLMEVCGSHTAAISKFGIRDILSNEIELISGPGCPVCVTPTAYIDRLIEIAMQPGFCVASFGDLLRVPGSKLSLSQAKGQGAQTLMVYSPMELIDQAKKNPDTVYVFAAVGFETTAPVYTLLLDIAIAEGLDNIRVLTSLKTMPGAISFILDGGAAIDGFIAPGHVCAVTGSSYFDGLAEKYRLPFAVSGFEDMQLIMAIYGLVRMIENKEYGVKNFYTSVVEEQANETAVSGIKRYFDKYDAAWRGMGIIKDSGLILKKEFAAFDMGSADLTEDNMKNKACRCGDILMGKAKPADCPLFATACSPLNPQGACMVSYEGACNSAYAVR